MDDNNVLDLIPLNAQGKSNESHTTIMPCVKQHLALMTVVIRITACFVFTHCSSLELRISNVTNNLLLLTESCVQATAYRNPARMTQMCTTEIQTRITKQHAEVC
jgi:hypothetical protein